MRKRANSSLKPHPSLEIILADEVSRGDRISLQTHLQKAGFE